MANYNRKYGATTVISHRIEIETNNVLSVLASLNNLSKAELINRILGEWTSKSPDEQLKTIQS